MCSLSTKVYCICVFGLSHIIVSMSVCLSVCTSHDICIRPSVGMSYVIHVFVCMSVCVDRKHWRTWMRTPVKTSTSSRCLVRRRQSGRSVIPVDNSCVVTSSIQPPRWLSRSLSLSPGTRTVLLLLLWPSDLLLMVLANTVIKGPFHQRQLTLTVGFLRTLTSS